LTNDVWMVVPVTTAASGNVHNSSSEHHLHINPQVTWKRLNAAQGSSSNHSSSQSLPSKRHCHSALIYKNHLIIFGGDSGGNEILNDMWMMDLRVSLKGNAANWQRMEYRADVVAANSMNAQHQQSTHHHHHHSSNHQHHHNPHVPKPRYAHSCVIIRDSMYLFGGFTRHSTKRAGGMYLDDLWRFHFATRTWHQISLGNQQPRPSKRCYHSAVVYDDSYMLVFGGSSQGAQYLNDVWLFDSRNEQWRKVEIRDGLNMVNGAHKRSNPNSSSSNRSSTRKTSIQDIREEQSAPVPRAKHAATMYDSNLMFVSGGYSGLFRENDFWMLHIEENSEERTVGRWYRLDGAPQSAHKLPVARDSHAVAMLGKHLFLFGGSGTGKLLNDFWTFDMSQVIQHFPALSAEGRNKVGGGHGDTLHTTVSSLTTSNTSQHDYSSHQSADPSPLSSHPRYNTRSSTASPLTRHQQHNHHDYSYQPHDETESSLEEEFFGQLSEALQDEERKRDHQRTEVHGESPASSSFQSTPPRNSIDAGDTPPIHTIEHLRDGETPSPSLHRPITSPPLDTKEQRSRSSLPAEYGGTRQQSVIARNSSPTAPSLQNTSNQRLTALEQQIQLLLEQQEEEEQRNKEFRDQVVKELHMAKNIMRKQGEALEGLEAVVHKEIQTRVAGEDKTQAYFNFISSQQANALALQTHQYQSSVERISQILQHLMKNKGGTGPNVSSVATAIQSLPSATPSEE